MKLVIVESPAKAKTINKYLGDEFKVIASFGHIRDLPSKKGSVIPDENFSMKYDISEKAGKYVDAIIKDAKKAESVYLATDPDREGESISWHIAEVIKEKNKVKSDDFFKRVAFNEITKKAITHAIENPRKLDNNLVNAQQARRALDYLVGFTLSPLLWRKLPGCKSAGRVQSVALRLICEREDEIERFKSEEYWDISLKMLNSNNELFTAKLTHINDQKLEKFSITNNKEAKDLTEKLKSQNFHVDKIEKKQQKRQPQPPFITSSLQQEAARKLGFSAKKTMQIAQKLYEGVDIGKETIGLITYMRTDGVTLSNDAVDEIRKLINKDYGDKYLPSSPRIYKSKVKNAQEAHEAIRPTNINYIPNDLKEKLEKDYYKLYELIWKRTIACQMENVIMDLVNATLASENKEYLARANGSTIAFDGFYKVYRESIDDEAEEENKMLPPLKEQEHLKTKEIVPNQHFTEPPPRYSEASLVKKLEELGIGRPSTYATILSVLQDRKYVTLEKKRFMPEELGRLVTVFLVGFFKKYVEYDFTAGLENELDEIAAGRLEWKSALGNFWNGFNHNIESVSKQNITEIISYVQQALDYHIFGENKDSKVCPSCKTGELSLKLGKFGAFLACSNYPECNFRKSIVSGNDNNEADGEAKDIVNENKVLGKDKEGVEIYLKKGPYGPYVQYGEQVDSKIKPKRSPLPAGLNQNDITLDMALKFLSLPLKIGNHKESGEEVLVGYGKFGPYIKYIGKFISIPKKYDFLNLSLDDAMKLIEEKLSAIAAKQPNPLNMDEVTNLVDKKIKVITRFAPSPTGMLHVGNIRAALLNWLYAKKHDGQFILRFDDTDLERSKQEYKDAIRADLKFLNLNWDQTFNQLSRLSRYDEIKKLLLDKKRLYACYETPEELELKRKFQLSKGLPPIYDRAALNLTEDQIQKYIEQGRKPHYRFLVNHEPITWHDMIKGEVKYEGKALSNPIVIRADGSMTYMLCSVIDDVDYEITHIIRGEDHVSNTAIQIQMFEALDKSPPTFGHLSLIINKDEKISKRVGGFEIATLREEVGLEAMAIASFFSLLGSSAQIIPHKKMDELVKHFEISSFSKSPTIYQPEDLERLNHKLLISLEFNEVKDRLKEIDAEYIDENFWLSVRPNLKKLFDAKDWWEIYHKTPNIKDLNLDKEYLKQAAELLPEEEITIETWGIWTKKLAAITNRKGKELFLPLRLALTGKESGPEISKMLPLIKREEIVRRLTNCHPITH